jgi:flagellar secretion chaperone FliS
MMIQPNATNAYREAAIRAASQIRLVMMMYDMVIDDLKGSVEAIRTNDIEKRTNDIKHALSVIEQLQGTLNMTDGGEAAITMDRLYSITRGRLLEACIKNSAPILREQVHLYTELRAAWQQVENKSLPFAAPEGLPEAPPATLAAAEAPPGPASCDWTA